MRIARAPVMAKRARRWSARVMRTSNALDFERGVFTQRTARTVARSLKRSAERSHSFHINRAGRGLSQAQRKVLEAAKDELRQLYGRKPHARKTHTRARAPKSARR